MPEPSGANRFHTFNAAFMFSGVAQFAHNAWLHAIQHSCDYGVGGLPHDSKDRDGNEQTDDRVGERKPYRYSECADHDREAGEPVGPGMEAIGDERRAVDLTSDLDAEHSHRLVPEEPDHAGGGKPAEMYNLSGMDESVDRLVSRHQGAEKNDQNDGEAGEVLNSAIAVGEGRRRLLP